MLPPLQLYFEAKLRPEGPKRNLGRPPPPPPYLRVWMTAPTPLSEGLDPPMLVATLELTRFLHCTLRKIITNSLYEFEIN